MKKIKFQYPLIVLILLFVSSPNFADPSETKNSLQTNLQLSISIQEIRIKNIRENIGDESGEFYFYWIISGKKVRLPANGELHLKKNDYIRPSDIKLRNEQFWYFSWTEDGTNVCVVEFEGWEKNTGSDNHLGILTVSLDLTDFKFITKNTYKKIETDDYYIIYTIRCEPFISSPSHPDSSLSYDNQHVTFNWIPTRPAGGILGNSYVLDNIASTEPDDILEGTHTTTSYSNLKEGTYWFHVKTLDKNNFWSNTGHFKVNIFMPIDVSTTISGNYLVQLYPNYPNPFNTSTVISYQLSQSHHVTTQIYSLTGQFIDMLINDYQSPGVYNIVWNGKDYNNDNVSSGVYVCVIKIGQAIKTIKMTLLQ